MELSRLRILFKKANSLPYLLRTLRNSSSSSSPPSFYPADVSPKRSQFIFDDAAEGGSSVYRHALKFDPPSTIKCTKELRNSVSFIGTVDRPPKTCGGLGAYTLINVKTSPDSYQFLKVFLMMQDEMAEIAIKHLKPDDCVYVSGHLESYTKIGEEEKLIMSYKVFVKEINYVVQRGQGLNNKKSEPSDSGEDSGETNLEKYKKRLHLWQIFFTNPSGWMDYRRRKPKPNHPDFKNRDTGEALWISRNDPPWIKRQLQRYDSMFSAEQELSDYISSRSSLSPLVL